jgi:hypothetical protein
MITEIPLPPELHRSAALLEERLKVLRVRTRKVPLSEWQSIPKPFHDFIPNWIPTLYAHHSILNAVLDCPGERQDDYQPLFLWGPKQYAESYAGFGVEKDSYLWDCFFGSGLAPLGENENSDSWITSIKDGPLSPIYLYEITWIDHFFASSRMELLFASMGIGAYNGRDTSVIWQSERGKPLPGTDLPSNLSGETGLPLELERSARSLEERLKILQVPTRKVPLSEWDSVPETVRALVPNWIPALLANYGLLGVVLGCFEYQGLSQLRLWEPAEYERQHESADEGLKELILGKGLVPFGSGDNGKYWVTSLDGGPLSSISVFSSAPEDHNMDNVEFASSRMELLMASMGISKRSFSTFGKSIEPRSVMWYPETPGNDMGRPMEKR